MRFLLAASIACVVAAASPQYELRGVLRPPSAATVYLYGATTPFSTWTLADPQGRFQFKKLLAGTYTISIYVRDRGEARQTVEIGPGAADSKHRVELAIDLAESRFVYSEVERHNKVSTSQLAIPLGAFREYEQAEKDLGRRDVAGARAHLGRAVEMAPQFFAAWNTLGTIAYQTRDFPRAEECFRRSLEAEPSAYEPLVNLGGVLVTLLKLEEALRFNTYAVAARPNDALANSQLGMTYFHLGRMELARKHLEEARKLDPAHFSHPQLLLAEIDAREKNWNRAAADLEDFLAHHPDWPQREKMRAAIQSLRNRH